MEPCFRNFTEHFIVFDGACFQPCQAGGFDFVIMNFPAGGGAVYRGEPDQEHHAAGDRAASGKKHLQPFAFPAAGRDHLQETPDRKTAFAR